MSTTTNNLKEINNLLLKLSENRLLILGITSINHFNSYKNNLITLLIECENKLRESTQFISIIESKNKKSEKDLKYYKDLLERTENDSIKKDSEIYFLQERLKMFENSKENQKFILSKQINTKSTFSDLKTANTTGMNNNISNSVTNSASNNNNNSRIERVSELVVKINNNDLSNRIKERLGKDYLKKLVDQSVSDNFINKVEYLVAKFSNSNIKNSNIDLNANNNDFIEKIERTKTKNKQKVDIEPTIQPYHRRKDSGFFNGSVTSSLNKLKSTKRSNSNFKLKSRFDSNDCIADNKRYHYQDYPYGWMNTRDYFFNNNSLDFTYYDILK